MRYIIIAMMFFLASQAQAQECGETQAEQNRCAADASKKADVELQHVYAELIKKLKPTERLRLQTAKRSWVVYRSEQCALESANAKANYPEALSQCYQTLTREYIARLQRYSR